MKALLQGFQQRRIQDLEKGFQQDLTDLKKEFDTERLANDSTSLKLIIFSSEKL